MSPAFPASELRYIVNQSQALALLTTEKYQDKSAEVAKDGIEQSLKFTKLSKIQDGGLTETSVLFEDLESQQGGLMLYTSGTTSRPVGLSICMTFNGY